MIASTFFIFLFLYLSKQLKVSTHWMLDVGCWMLDEALGPSAQMPFLTRYPTPAFYYPLTPVTAIKHPTTKI
jgi:hypothetical protein